MCTWGENREADAGGVDLDPARLGRLIEHCDDRGGQVGRRRHNGFGQGHGVIAHRHRPDHITPPEARVSG
jgi:hypothetical protein